VQGLWDAYERGEGREAAVASAFRSHGLDPMRPWLEAGSQDIDVFGAAPVVERAKA
jgi:hypothetical protein